MMITSIIYGILFFVFLCYLQTAVQGKKPESESKISNEARQGQKSQKKKKKRKKNVKRDDDMKAAEEDFEEIDAKEGLESSDILCETQRRDNVVVELTSSSKQSDRMNSPPSPYQLGMAVEGYWEESGDWYPAIVTKVHRSGRISLKFDDGEVKENMDATLIRTTSKKLSQRAGAVVAELPAQPVRTKSACNHDREDDGWQLVDSPKTPKEAAVERQEGREEKSANLRNRKKRERKREKEREIREIQRRSAA